jgi:4-amino-4-deoxy-L-arabinose transferase-like glycosyltransferase
MRSLFSRCASAIYGVPLALVIVTFVRVLFVFSYPPNVGGDAVNYYDMLLYGKSNLIHAPGYPFLIGLPWRHLLDLPTSAELHPRALSYALIASQHLLSILVLLMMYRVLAEIWTPSVAALTVFLYGCSPMVLAATSTFYPEWLQADLFILTMCLGFYAAHEKNVARKAGFYALMLLALTWGYLTKFNTLFLVPLVFFVLIADRSPLRRKVKIFLLGLVLPVASVAAFVHLYHKPSTGTYALTHDHAWVLLYSLGFWVPGKTLDERAGIWTKRLLYLNRVLPWTDDVGPVESVDSIPRQVRDPYREKYLWILQANEATLDDLLAVAPPQRDPFNFVTAFHPTFKHIGVREGDELGIHVFVEQVRAFPAAYVRHVLNETVRSILHWPESPLLPLTLSEGEYERASFGFFWRRQVGPSYRQEVWYQSPYVWGPGVWSFGKLNSLMTVPPLCFILLMAGGCIVAARSMWVNGIGRGPLLVLVLTVFIVFFMASSNAVMEFRWKEALLVLPLILTVASASMFSIYNLLRRKLIRTRGADVCA